MCYHDHNPFKAVQVIFQPGCHLIVQVVRRLVQDQNVCRINKDSRKCHTFFLTTGKMRNLFFMIFDSQFIKHHMRFRFRIPALLFLSLCHIRKNCCTFRKFRMLRKVSGAKSVLGNYLSFICFFQSCKNSKKCSLSGTIDANDPNLVPLMDSAGDIIKDYFFSISFTDMFQVQYVHLYAPYCKSVRCSS